jgi:type II secretory pathway component PulF
MSFYSFIAIDSTGQRVSGQVEASDPDAVVSQLSVQGLRIESVLLLRDAEQKPSAGASMGAAAGSLRAADVREIGGHIAEIASAGLPLEAGLAAIAEELPRGRLRRELRKIVADLETGIDLESALSARRAPPYVSALVQAGRRTGRTGAILESFISSTRIAFDLRQTLMLALIYPAALLVIVLLIAAILQSSVIPEFAKVFEGFGLKLPWATVMLIEISKLMNEFGWLALAFVAVAALVVSVLAFLAMGPIETRRMICRIPAFGPLVRWAALARFSPLLSLLIESRVPLDQALVLAGESSGDALIYDDCRKLAERVRAGESLEMVARSGRGLPISFVRAIGLERERRGLPDVLQSMADVYAGRARALAALLALFLPIIVVSLIGTFVSFVVLALMWPLIDMLRLLSM